MLPLELLLGLALVSFSKPCLIYSLRWVRAIPGWVMKRADVWDEFTNSGTLSFNRKAFPIIYFLMKYLAPIGIVIIFVTNFLP